MTADLFAGSDQRDSVAGSDQRGSVAGSDQRDSVAGNDGSAGTPVGPDPLGRRASEFDGAQSLLTGLAANESLAAGQAVRVRDVLDLDAYGPP
jgi:hypothetical protein